MSTLAGGMAGNMEQATERIGILVVDDEDFIHALARRILEREGYQVFTCLDNIEAISVLKQNRDRIHLALIDVLLPNIEGTALAVQLEKIHPSMRLLFSSGYGVTPAVQDFIDGGKADFIAKPFTRNDILEKINGILN